MTIKALNGGKLLCLMATVAGVMTLGSCNKDDDDPEPEPAPVVPVDTTPKKVVYPDQFSFRLNNSTPDTLNSGDTIKANTLLADGINTDSVSVDVVLRNKTMVDPTSVSFTVSNTYLGKVSVSGTPSISDSIYSITFPAIEGSYALSINGKTRNFTVAGTGKELSKSGRTLSNVYTMNFNKTVTSNFGIKFVPYNAAEDAGARLTADAGDFIALSEEEYNTIIKATSLSTITDFVEDATPVAGKLMLKNVKYFIYSVNGKNYVMNITDFAGSDVDTSDLTMTVTY